MTAPRQVTVRLADLRTMTGAELFEALAHAGLTRARVQDALDAIGDPDGDPATALRGMRFLQAVALAMARRDGDPSTWEDAQGWAVTADATDAQEDPAEAERREYRVAASLATGLPGPEAEALPLVEVEEYARRRAGVGR